jgi:structural maintenance of chromosome 2
LVYKQGQAGVTKASVTIIFNNSDASSSPIGYESHKQITVTRQVNLYSYSSLIAIFLIMNI